MKKRVVIGLSGGVDSSVAAYLLKKQGYETIAVFMRNWVDDNVILSEECPWVEDSKDALLVADKLGIPFHVIDFSKEYKERIVDYMFNEYKVGKTPNPDILCNREVKFDLFLNKALDLDADFVATGHYCRKTVIKVNEEIIYELKMGKDQNKDQSYFLCQVNQHQLKHSLFPIGALEKKEVRRIAKEQGLVTAEKKDSQGLCFIGKVKLPDFLQQQLLPKEGNIFEILSSDNIFKRTWNSNNFKKLSKPYSLEEGNSIYKGKHNGAHFFTIGQRKGLKVGGTLKPLFVIGTNTKTNVVFVGQGENHPGLYRKVLFVKNKDIFYVNPTKVLMEGNSKDYKARIRYRQTLQSCKLYRKKEGMYIVFNTLQRAISPGQFVAWYEGDELVGSGVIS